MQWARILSCRFGISFVVFFWLPNSIDSVYFSVIQALTFPRSFNAQLGYFEFRLRKQVSWREICLGLVKQTATMTTTTTSVKWGRKSFIDWLEALKTSANRPPRSDGRRAPDVYAGEQRKTNQPGGRRGRVGLIALLCIKCTRNGEQLPVFTDARASGIRRPFGGNYVMNSAAMQQ